MVRNKTRRHKKLLYLLLLLAILALVFAILQLTHVTHFFQKPPVSTPGAPITQLPHKPLANNGDKNVSTSSTFNHQTATDQHGQNPGNVSNDPSQWLTSESGVITVKLPTANSKLSPGGELYGSATSGVAQVQYRLIDNQVGVISEGRVSVVNGNFTASVNFKAYASSGRLDVFTADANGKESNEVQVPVTF